METLPLQPNYTAHDHLTVAELLSIILEYHLAGKACARPYRSNMKAWIRTSGRIYIDALNEPDVLRHMNIRKSEHVSAQTIRHDIGLLTLAYNTAYRYKRNRYKVAGFDFGNLHVPFESPTKYVKRPRAKPRKKPITEMEFAKWIEHCPPRLAERSFFAVDTGQSPIVLKSLRPSDYNPYTDCLDVQRGKTEAVGSIPVTDRCRAIIFRAIEQKREFILDWTAYQEDIEKCRRKSGVNFWFGRDLRTTFGNRIFKATNSDQAASKAMLHRDPRTFVNHYKVDHAEDLRPAIRSIENIFK